MRGVHVLVRRRSRGHRRSALARPGFKFEQNTVGPVRDLDLAQSGHEPSRSRRSALTS